MRELKNIPIGAHLKLTSGFPFASSQFSNEGFPLIRIRDVLKSSTETYFQGPFPPGYVIKRGNILVGMDGDFHVVRWRGSDALLNQRVLKVDVIDESIVLLDFVYHWLGPFIKKINDVTAATTVKHLSTKDLVKAKAPLPSIAAQRRIATILTSIDSAIEKTEALIEKFQKIKAGLMHDLFTRGVLPNGQLRPRREHAPDLYRETAIGWIPCDWEIVRMVDLAENRNGSTTIGPFGSDLVTTDYRLEGVPVVFVRDIKESGFEWNSETYISEKKALRLSAHSIKAGELLATKMGLPPCLSCIYPEWMPNGVITADVIRLSPDKKKVDGRWLTAAINHDRVKRQIAAITAGVTRPKVTLKDFRGIRIAKPLLDEQRSVSDKLGTIERRIRTEIIRVGKLKSQKLGLMQDLLTGKISVNVESEIVEMPEMANA